MRWYWLKCVQRLLLNSAQLEHWRIKISNKFKEGAVEKEVQWSKTVAQNPAFTTYCNQSLFPCLKLKCRKIPKVYQETQDCTYERLPFVCVCLKISWKSLWKSAEHKRLSVDLRNGKIIKQNLRQSFTSLFWIFDLNTSYLHYHCCNCIKKSSVTELQTKSLLKHRKFLLTDSSRSSLWLPHFMFSSTLTPDILLRKKQ